ncbi:MAG: hypothetical protein K0R00_3216 [Herbinix sp.]|jgi:uncharacterized protein YmfQ (DUF2313 family)|nr:hypothetical protein [Herbinix sp.]
MNYIDLMSLLPDFYKKSNHVIEIQSTFGYEAGEINDSTKVLFNQLFVSTATWGLELWEKTYGIQTDISKPLSQRREILLAKLRGAGTTTKEMIKNVATAYSKGEIEIIEYPQESRFIVKFVGNLGIPDNMADLTKTLDDIKPAHLSYTYEYMFNTHSVLSEFKHNQLSEYTHKQLKEGELT